MYLKLADFIIRLIFPTISNSFHEKHNIRAPKCIIFLEVQWGIRQPFWHVLTEPLRNLRLSESGRNLISKSQSGKTVLLTHCKTHGDMEGRCGLTAHQTEREEKSFDCLVQITRAHLCMHSWI